MATRSLQWIGLKSPDGARVADQVGPGDPEGLGGQLHVQGLPAYDELGPDGDHRLAGGGAHVGAGGQEVVPAAAGDVLDGVHADQLVAGHHRPGVGEPLVAVDHPAVVDPEGRVVDDLPGGGHRDHHREGRRSDHVRVPERAGGLRVVVGRVGGADRRGELADLFTAHLVGGRSADRSGRRRTGPGTCPQNLHGKHESRPGGGRAAGWPRARSGSAIGKRAAGVRRRRSAGLAVDRVLAVPGQNFFSSMRSGSLRRFLRVM